MEKGAAMRKGLPLALAILGACTPYVSGLMPVEPAPDGSRTASLQPVLRWEPLPEASDARVSDLVYDVQLRGDSGALILDREGLTSCEYRVETPLTSDRDYSWTVRARFRWEGRRRQTEWSRLADNNDRLAVLPDPPVRYLPFRTPESAIPRAASAGSQKGGHPR
jgi:hypothetical protein